MTDVDESVLLGDVGDVSDPIDESALLDENSHEHDESSMNENETKNVKEELDLYDDAMAPSNTSLDNGSKPSPQDQSVVTTNESSTATNNTTSTTTASTTTNTRNDGKKYCCYVGNLTWYTTDADLLKMISTFGIPRKDFADMKFFESRINGQSKGYALLVFNVESAVKTVMEILPTKSIHGSTPNVYSYNKANQQKLEELQSKTLTRPDIKKKVDERCMDMGTIRIGNNQLNQNRNQPTSGMGRNGPPPLMMQNNNSMNQMMRGPPQPLMGSNQIGNMRPHMNGQQQPQQQQQPPSQQIQMMNRNQIVQPQMIAGMNPMQQQNLMMTQQNIQQNPRPLMGGLQTTAMPMQSNMGMSAPPPAMMQQQYAQNRIPQYGTNMTNQAQPLMSVNTAMRPPVNGMPPVHVNPQMFPSVQGTPLTDAEYEDILNRNRTVASSAIGRAVADAAAGDGKSANETLLTAINLIKQSRAGHDDISRGLIQSLEETLKGIESRSGYSRSKSYRDRSRSRDRERKRRRRSRTRSYSRSPSPHRTRRRY